MAKQKPTNLPKYIAYGAIGLLAVVFVLPLLGGVLSGVNPNKSVQMAQQKTMESKEVYVPEGYQITKRAERVELENEVIFVTQMTNETNQISVIKQSSLPECQTEALQIAGLQVCSSETKDQSGNSITHYSWETDSGAYQLDFVTGSLSADELANILQSI